MKTLSKIIFTVCFFTLSFNAHAQFPEGFEGTSFPPADWESFIGTNGIGTVEDWQQTTVDANTGANSAFVEYEPFLNGVAEDWLVTPQFTPNADFDGLSFFQRQQFDIEFGSIYTIRVSTGSQTDHSDFVIIDTQVESDFTDAFTEKIVDLSAYNFTPIYVAFVMEQDNGDSWYIDDVTQVQVPPCNNSSLFGNITIPSDGSLVSVSCALPGDYIRYNGIQQGLQYKFSSGNPSDYITVRNATNNGLLSFGVGDQFITALTNDDVEVHINLDDGSCGTDTNCRAATAECTTCVAFNNCNGAPFIDCGDAFIGESTVGSTDDGNPGSCTVGVGNWYKFAPTVTTAVNLVVTPEASYDVKMAITTTPDCIDFTLFSAGCQDQQGAGGQEKRDFVAEAGTTYHIYVGCPGATCTEVGMYDIELFCSQDNWSCSAPQDMVCGDSFVGETTAGAIREIFSPGGCQSGEGLWYRFAPTTDGTATVTLTPAADFDAQLSVLTTTDCSNFTAVPNGCVNTFQDGFVETLVYDYTGGTEYYIYAGNASINQEDGLFDLSVSCVDGFCDNTTLFPSASISAPSESNTIVTIATNQWAGDYAVITDLSAGETYFFTNTVSDLITVRDATSGEALMEGVAPLIFTTLSNNDLEVHYNLNDGNCGVENVDRTTAIECLSCPCPAEFTFSTGTGLVGSVTSNIFYLTDGDLESTQIIEASADVIYSAIGDITLMNGFEVVQGAELTTSHDGCGFFSFQEGDEYKYKTIIEEKLDSEALRRKALNK